MDEEAAGGYKEPCALCGAVSWNISDEGHFFCTNCHNVIERTQHASEETIFLPNSRVSSIASGRRKRNKNVRGRDWMVCEGFQFILKHQAEALVGLGVNAQFKTTVLWEFWKRYLQKTRQAYSRDPLRTQREAMDLTSGSEDEAVYDGDALSAVSGCSDGKSSVTSGSLDVAYYFSPMEKKKRHLMSMPRTLALCHLALLWLREAITLADLLRLVSKGHVPYINVHEDFPEEMKLFGRDCLIFKVETLPSYSKVHEEAVKMAEIMELSTFPSVSQDCLLHPALLSLRYLLDANLPDRLHGLVCTVIKKTAMGKDFFLTFAPAGKKPKLPLYDVQAAGLIIVTMKLLFQLDDRAEWTLSKKANGKQNGQEGNDENQSRKKKKTKQGSRLFSLRTWYMTVQPALERARRREERADARRQWKSKVPVIPYLCHKAVFMKRRRVVEQLQKFFQNVFGPESEQQPPSPSSFLFRWGKQEGADGPSLRHKRVHFLLKKKGNVRRLVNRKYWHTALRPCRKQDCRDHFPELEPSLPKMYVWILDLFSFLLGVSQSLLHSEVVKVERRLLGKTKLTNTGEPPSKIMKKTCPE